ncbi:MAG: hypothetical protein ACT443_09835 [Gemmatimonadota bacterium]
MIFRKYGTSAHSVDPNFDAKAMNEIGFMKNGTADMPWEEFQQTYERIAGHELTAEAEGNVQHEAEERMLNDLRDQLAGIESGVGANHVLLVESELGKDYPKTREKVSNVVVGNENRLYFNRTIEPPLRVGVYAPRKR